MAKEMFGETKETRECLIQDLREAAIEKGFVGLPDKKAFYLKMLRAGK